MRGEVQEIDGGGDIMADYQSLALHVHDAIGWDPDCKGSMGMHLHRKELFAPDSRVM